MHCFWVVVVVAAAAIFGAASLQVKERNGAVEVARQQVPLLRTFEVQTSHGPTLVATALQLKRARRTQMSHALFTNECRDAPRCYWSTQKRSILPYGPHPGQVTGHLLICCSSLLNVPQHTWCDHYYYYYYFSIAPREPPDAEVAPDHHHSWFPSSITLITMVGCILLLGKNWTRGVNKQLLPVISESDTRNNK